MRPRFEFLALLALVLLLGGAAVAVPPHHEGAWSHMSERCDTDNDNRITRAEFDACHGALFGQLDGDGDGAITEEEAPGATHTRMLAGMIAKNADEDADGRITSAEWQGLVGRLDADGNGVVVPEEIHAVIAPDLDGGQMRQRRGGPGGAGRGPGPGGPPMEFTVDHLYEAFDMMDTDASGDLEEEELATAMQGLHRKMALHHGPHGPNLADADGDGQVTAEEWDAHFRELDQDGDGVLEPEERPRMRHRHGRGD